MSCASTAFIRDRTQASRFIVRRANHCTTEAHIYVYAPVKLYEQKQMMKTIANLKNGKAAGVDEIMNEILMYERD